MKIWGFILLFISLSAGAADTYTLANKLNTDTKDFEALADVLSRPESQTPVGFLTEWKKEKPDFFSNYVTAYRSRSLQQADRLHPRAILFNVNADMVLSFNGHPEYRGYSQIEMMRFNHAKNSFEFYEVAFEKGKKAALSAPNPRKCLECHQSSARAGVDPRPNWEPYSVWLGFYGSLDDVTDLFKSSFTKDKYYRPETDAILLSDFDNETAWYDEFLYSKLPSDERYSLLDPIYNTYNSSERTLNGDLTNRLGTLNFRRVARLMKEQTAIYEKVKWTIWGFGVCGQNFYVSKDVFDWLNQITPRKELERREPMVQMPFHCTPSMEFCDPNSPPKPQPYFKPYVETGNVINLMFEPFGVDTEDWSMDFKSEGRFAFADRFGVTNDPRPPFSAALKAVFGQDPDFKNISCDDVRERSLENFGSLKKAKAIHQELVANLPPISPTKPLLERCMTCHVNNTNAGQQIPPLPFNDPVALKAHLAKSGYKRGTLMDEILYRTGPYAIESEQMPPRGIPTIKERNELIDFLKSL